jgi:hypothetical protein
MTIEFILQINGAIAEKTSISTGAVFHVDLELPRPCAAAVEIKFQIEAAVVLRIGVEIKFQLERDVPDGYSDLGTDSSPMKPNTL